MRTRSRLIAALISLVLAGMSQGAVAADGDIKALQQQLKVLQENTKQLQQKLERYESHTPKQQEAPAAASQAGPATAGEAAPAAVTQDDVNGLRSDLENFKYQYNRDREYNTAQTTRPVSINGLVQARAGYDSVANGNNTAPNTALSNQRSSSFANGSAALQFSGLLYKDYEEGRNLAYTLRIAANPSTASGQNFGNGVNNIYVQFANLTYNFRPTLNPEDPRLALTLGQQILPFGLDVAAPDELKPTISGAQFAGNLFGTGIDIGAVARGEAWVQYDYGYSYRAPVLQYYIGATNGTGPNTLDNNSSKDVLGRLVFTVPTEYNSWLRQLAVGTSAYIGRQNTAYPNITAAGALAGTLSGQGRKNRYGFDVYYNHHPFGVTYEYVRGEDGRTYGTTADARNPQQSNSEDHVATLYYTFGEQFLYANSALGTTPIAQGRFDDWWPKSYQPFVRLDYWNPSTNKPNGTTYGWKQDIKTLGFNIFFAQTTKFQLNYNLISNQNPKVRNDHQLLAQVQFAF